MDISSLAASASAVKQSQVRNQIDTAIAAKSLQAQKDQGEAAVEMIKQAAQVQASGRGVDIRA